MPLQYKKGTCTQCKSEDVYIVKKLPSGHYCTTCNDIRLNKDAEEYPFSSIKLKKKKPTGEGVMFKTIWETRPHKSFINNEWLGNEACSWMFAHVLPKAQNKFPLFKLYDKNIVLLTWEQHDLWDYGLRSDLIKLTEWEKMFVLEEELRKEYLKLLNR